MKALYVTRTDVNISKCCQAFPEFRYGSFVGFDLIALGVFTASFLLRMEAQILQQDDFSPTCFVDLLFDFLAYAIICECDLLAQKLFQLWDDRLQAILGVLLAVWAAKVGHEDDGFGSMIDSILDGRQSSNDSLVVRDFLVGIQRNVKVDLVTNLVKYVS